MKLLKLGKISSSPGYLRLYKSYFPCKSLPSLLCSQSSVWADAEWEIRGSNSSGPWAEVPCPEPALRDKCSNFSLHFQWAPGSPGDAAGLETSLCPFSMAVPKVWLLGEARENPSSSRCEMGLIWNLWGILSSSGARSWESLLSASEIPPCAHLAGRWCRGGFAEAHWEYSLPSHQALPSIDSFC